MGWVFIFVGIALVGAGTFLGIYGQSLLGEKQSAQSSTVAERLLTPSQERLLALLFRYQRDFAASKLVVGRNGQLHFEDEERRKTVKVNFLTELYGTRKR